MKFRADHPKHDVATTKGSKGEILPIDNLGLPSSETKNGLCPRCNRLVSFKEVDTDPFTYNFHISGYGYKKETKYGVLEQVVILECQNCFHNTVVIEKEVRIKTEGPPKYKWVAYHWFPLPEDISIPSIPIDIASTYKEGIRALYANCPRAAAAMARKTLELITVDKKETSGDLKTRINNLYKKGALTETLFKVSDKIRYLGNAAAHNDIGVEVSIEEARQLIEFIKHLFTYLYQIEDQVSKL